MTDETKLSQKEKKHQTPDELLDTQEVSQMLGNIDSTIAFLSSIPPNERVKQFAQADHFLGNFYKEREQAPEITQTEEQALDIINDQLKENMPIVNKMIDTLIESQRINLLNRRVPTDKAAVEIKHIQEVVELTRRIFPNMPILHLAAAVHDSYKYNLDGKMELGLHELAGTALGPVLVEKLLLKHKSEILFSDESSEKREINQAEIDLILRLVQRTIETHGTDEFPDLNANFSDDENPNIGELFGSVKPRSTKKSWSLLDKEPSTTSITIAALNYLDSITGTNHTSFIKYNNPATYPNNIFTQEVQTLGEFITNKLFSSFESNIAMNSGNLLLQLENIPGIHNIEELKKIVTINRLVKDVIELSITRQFSKLSEILGDDLANSILRLVKYLENSFKKLQETIAKKQQASENIVYLNERREFDQLLSLFMQTMHEIVLEKLKKTEQI